MPCPRRRPDGQGSGSATWFSLTREGRAAYKAHVAALCELLDEAKARSE